MVGALAAAAGGCGYSTHRVVRELTQPRTHRELEKLAPDVEKAASELARGLIDGGFAELSEPEKQAAVQAATARFMDGVEEASRRAGYGLADGAREPVDRMIEDALADLTSDGTRAGLSRLGHEAARATSDGLMDGVNDGVTRLGPKVGKILHDDIGPEVQHLLGERVPVGVEQALERPALRKALGDTAREVSYEAMVGVDAGIIRVWDGHDGAPGLGARLDAVLNQGREGLEKLLVWLLVGAGVLIVLAITVAAWFRWARGRAEQERDARTAAMGLVSRAVHAAETTQRGSMKAYRDAVRDLARNEPTAYAQLQSYLAENQAVKLP